MCISIRRPHVWKLHIHHTPAVCAWFTSAIFLYSFFSSSFFLGLHLLHLEVPRLGVKSELQLAAYATATVTSDLSRVCDLHHSLWQRWILNPLSKARDQTRILMHTGQIRFCCATTGTPYVQYLNQAILGGIT